MAALDLQEQEQLDALKAWWNDNSSWIMIAILTLVVALLGWRGWQYYQQRQAGDAAALYQQVIEQISSKDPRRVNDAAAAVMDKFSSTPYASRAALVAAEVNELGNDPAHARTQLQWVIDHAGEPALKDVARLRLASLLLDEKNYADATRLLEAKHTDSFDGLYADLTGEVLNAQGKTDAARSAYKLAYEKYDPQSLYRSLITMKMDALGAVK
jgi:predicted negative regulator of RcsB-dependent stress response